MQKPLNNIYLIGPMGAGKTTIGRLLAEELNKQFLDSDLVIEERAGADISWIFDVEGEAGFRVREQNVIKELTTLDNIVLATGGGAILAEENRKNLRRGGTVIYLMATITQQVERTRRDQKRPLLHNTPDPRGKLTSLMEIRDPLYREIADYVVMTSRRSPKAVSTEIIQMISSSASGSSNV
jgi:shikimate kinase